MPAATFTVTAGSIKFAVPIWIAVAPASKNSTASFQFMIPPSPITGIFTALATCHTMRNAMGLTAAPLIPPVVVDNTGLRFSASIAIPSSVLISETLSAPAPSTARAISVMSVTFGESFTISVFLYALRTALTTSAAPRAVTPKAIPPCFTFGQEIFSSMAGIFSSSLMMLAVSA